jgi:tRNA U34 2-thiouridine synthase MnmA/TrmU
VRDCRFVEQSPSPSQHVQAQVRAHGEPVDAVFDGDAVRFAVPQARVAPGQVVALYEGDVLLGGGIAC